MLGQTSPMPRVKGLRWLLLNINSFQGLLSPIIKFLFYSGKLDNRQKKIQHMNRSAIPDCLEDSRCGSLLCPCNSIGNQNISTGNKYSMIIFYTFVSVIHIIELQYIQTFYITLWPLQHNLRIRCYPK